MARGTHPSGTGFDYALPGSNGDRGEHIRDVDVDFGLWSGVPLDRHLERIVPTESARDVDRRNHWGRSRKYSADPHFGKHVDYEEVPIGKAAGTD